MNAPLTLDVPRTAHADVLAHACRRAILLALCLALAYFLAAAAATASPVPLGVHVLAPNGGEGLVSGRPYVIRWSADGPVESFSVRLVRNDGTTAGIADCNAVDGSARSCEWRQPHCPGLCPAGQEFHVQVVAFGPDHTWAEDTSDGSFRLLGLVIDEPGVGVYWRNGERARIAWRHNLGAGARFIVEVSTDGGKTFVGLYDPIETYAPTQASVDFFVSFRTTTKAVVRVTFDEEPLVRDVSNYYFSIGILPRPVKYRITDLGAADDISSEAAGLSPSGIVAGSAHHASDDSLTAFRWDERRIELGTLGGCCSVAAGVNRFGDTVGWARTSAGVFRAFAHEPGAAMRDLGTLGGDFSEATAVNDAGIVVGSSAVDGSLTTTNWHAFLWAGGSMQDLGTLGGPGSAAAGVNNLGVVVGRSRATADGPERAFEYRDGAMRDISPASWNESAATAINDHGDIVGWRGAVRRESLSQTAFLRTADGRIRELGALGGSWSMATAINGYGDVVGNTNGVPFFYGKGGMRDLNVFVAPDTGWVLRSANSINDRGQIAGTGEFGGTLRAFLLTPIVHLKSISMESRLLAGCSLGQARITLDAPAPEDIVIALTDNSVVLSQPVVVVPAGETSAYWRVEANAWASARDGIVSATYGDQTLVLSVRVKAIAPESMRLGPARAGELVSGAVALPCAASEPIEVRVTSSAPRVASVETPRVIIEARTSQASFSLRAHTSGQATIVTRTAGGSLTSVLDVSGGTLPGVESGPWMRNGHTYYLLTPSDWFAAETKAQELGGHLVTINDEAENAWVFDTFASYGGVRRMLWLGLTDARHEGVFVWTSGEAASYRHFDAGEPNNDGGNPLGREDVVHMYPSLDRRGSFWNDVNPFAESSFPFHGVVEVPRLP